MLKLLHTNDDLTITIALLFLRKRRVKRDYKKYDIHIGASFHIVYTIHLYKNNFTMI